VESRCSNAVCGGGYSFFEAPPYYALRCDETKGVMTSLCLRERERETQRREILTLIRVRASVSFAAFLCFVSSSGLLDDVALRIRAKHDLVLPHLDPCVYAYVRALILVRSLLRSTTSLWGAVCVLLLDDKVRINTNHMCRKLDLQPWTTN
jgi:hypothetical protein